MTIRKQEYKLLDNPVWHALQTVHKHFAAGTSLIQRYPAEVLRIAGCAYPATAGLHELEQWVKPGEKIFIVGDLPPVPENWANYINIDCVQMVCPELKPFPAKEKAPIKLLVEDDPEEMLALVNLVQPGFF